jgi:lipopolysaccharide/colanic/teichoic acid biosynthesis glycosyltransferase
LRKERLGVESLCGTANEWGSVRAGTFDRCLKRVFDVVVAAVLLMLLSPAIVGCALAVKLESRGPAFFRCRRVGQGGREFEMLKFRKMWDGAGGSKLTGSIDDRFTRMGRFLARTKLDELPQLWNVLRGSMSLVGPRPEDQLFVGLKPDEFARVLTVRPGMTGLCQVAFACESVILDREGEDGRREERYIEQLLPQKLQIDGLYATQRTFSYDLKILWWTCVAVIGRKDVAVNRRTGEMTLRRRPRVLEPAPVAVEPAVAELVE